MPLQARGAERLNVGVTNGGWLGSAAGKPITMTDDTP
jgi:hypothetical protein